MPVLNKFQTLLRQRRAKEDREITLIEISEKTGVSRDTLSRYFGQKITQYNSDTVEKLCRYFKVEVGEFLYLDPTVDRGDQQPEAQRS